MIADSGDRTSFDTGAVRDLSAGKGRMDLLPWFGIIEVAKHCEEGAAKYGEHNVDLGLPEWSLISSAARHLGEYICGLKNEDHLRAAAWNILWALNQRTTHPELMTLNSWRDQEPVSKNHVETCRERLMKEYPICCGVEFTGGCAGCTSEYGYATEPEAKTCCSEAACTACWSRPVEQKE